ncbi:MAG TPA: galactosyldiacylglycerol synthase [Planctomycetes bacterium]|nr:galactosyldiacylglycerol synthase [Planctomycetota bacterium]
MRILVLHATVGGGHKSAAMALGEAFRALDPAGAVEVRDTLDFTPRVFKKLYAGSYFWLIDHSPETWGYLYEHAGARTAERQTARLLRAFDRLNYRRLLRFIEDFAPDAVVATHFLPTEILMPLAAKGAFAVPYWLVLTDHDAHAVWVRRGPHAFFVGSEEVRVLLEKAGIEPARVRVTGIPISRRFLAPPGEAAARASLGVPRDGRVVLLMGGAGGFSEMAPFARALAAMDDTHTLAVAGRNEELGAAFDELAAAAPRLRPFRFVADIERLMQAADVVVTKSGGLTTSECLAMGRPMVIIRPTPGQEERNADYLLEAGAAIKARTPESLAWKIARLWREPARLRVLADAARALARPNAAEDVAREVLGAPGARASPD